MSTCSVVRDEITDAPIIRFDPKPAGVLNAHVMICVGGFWRSVTVEECVEIGRQALNAATTAQIGLNSIQQPRCMDGSRMQA